MKIVFIYLMAFQRGGGIEIFNRCFCKALQETASEAGSELIVISLYDDLSDEKYLSNDKFISCKGNKLKFLVHCIEKCRNANVIICGHINLSLVILFVKLFNSKLKVFMVAHGIEVWDKVLFIQKLALKLSDKILAVSTFTKQKLITVNKVASNIISIFPNTLDPYFLTPVRKTKPQNLLERYGFKNSDKIFITISRLKSSEKYKGYDRVIEVLPRLKQTYPNIKYLICGSYEPLEYSRIISLIKKYDLQDVVLLTGYIPDEELVNHYQLADVFIMPSKKEGFGIVFLEAIACGLPVIAGNQDGSKDALLNGKLGLLVNPDSNQEIYDALLYTLSENNTIDVIAMRNKMLENYSFDKFKERTYKALFVND